MCFLSSDAFSKKWLMKVICTINAAGSSFTMSSMNIVSSCAEYGIAECGMNQTTERFECEVDEQHRSRSIEKPCIIPANILQHCSFSDQPTNDTGPNEH